MLKLHLSWLSLPLLPVDQDVELSAPPAPCFLPDNNGVTLSTVSLPQLNVFLDKHCHGHGVSLQPN